MEDPDDRNYDGGEKKSRRSKNDNDGRDFKCKHCDKTYLSYPALYTHSKQKHAKGPDGAPQAPPSSGRGRGRPRKVVSITHSISITLFLYSHTTAQIPRVMTILKPLNVLEAQQTHFYGSMNFLIHFSHQSTVRLKTTCSTSSSYNSLQTKIRNPKDRSPSKENQKPPSKFLWTRTLKMKTTTAELTPRTTLAHKRKILSGSAITLT
jgi:hypothetical protein